MSWKFFTAAGAEKRAPSTITVPAARIHAAGNQAIPTSSNTQVTLGVVDYDTDGMTSTANAITIQHAGKYRLSGQIDWTNAAGGNFRAGKILQNGTLVAAHYMSVTMNAVNDQIFCFSTDIACAAGDVITLQAAQDSGGNLNILGASQYGSVLSATKIDGAVVSYVGVPGSLVGQELAYVESTVLLNLTLAEQTFLTTGSITLDGVTPVVVEAFIPYAAPPSTAQSYINSRLKDGATIIGESYSGNAAALVNVYREIRISRRFTPTAGAHTFSYAALMSAGAGAFVSGGVGTGAGAPLPAYIRVTRAA